MGAGSPTMPEPDRLIAEPDRWFVALDGDDIVGTAGACTTELTVPGGTLSGAGRHRGRCAALAPAARHQHHVDGGDPRSGRRT